MPAAITMKEIEWSATRLIEINFVDYTLLLSPLSSLTYPTGGGGGGIIVNAFANSGT